MQKWPKPFVGTCYRCGEVGHRACNCRKSADLPEHSTNKTRKTIPTVVDVDLEKAALGGDPAERACGVNEGTEMIADVNRTALLGQELVERACRVNKGDKMIVDVDRTATLGGEPAETVCGVNKGDEEHEPQT